MAAVKGSNGLYLWAHDFWIDQGVGGLLQSTKDEIVERYLTQYAPQLFSARAQASFGGQLGMEAIDNFFKGTNTSQGYVAELQAKLNEYYSEELRNAEEIFKSQLSGLNQKLTSTKGPLTPEDLTQEQQADLARMMQAQQAIFEKLGKLVSGYEAYVLERATDKGYNPPRKIHDGLYFTGNYSDQGLNEAIRIYNDIQKHIQQLKAVEVGSDLSHSFTAFRETAHAFHSTCAEYVTLISVYDINKAQKQLFKDSPFDQSWTGNSKYLPGQGDISISMYYNFDPEIQEIINASLDTPPTKKITATNDVSISAGPEGVIGHYGITVKDYTDQTLAKTQGFTTIASSMGNIYEAAAFASTRGLPINMATHAWINNLAGALTPSFDIFTAQNYWSEYKQLLGNLLSVDALMGRMLSGNISSQGNNLVMIDNGHAYYMGDIINNLKNNVQGFTGSMFGQNNFFIQDSARAKAEQAHWENFISGGTAEQAMAAIEAIISSVSIKISLNLHNLLAGL